MYSHQVRQKSLNSWLRPLLSTIQSFISLWMKDFGGHSYELSSVTTGREWLRMKQQIITLSSQRQETLGEKIIWLLQPQQRYELTLVVIIDYEVRTWYRLKVFFGFRSNAGFTRIRNEWLGTHYAVWGKLVKTRGKRLQSSWRLYGKYCSVKRQMMLGAELTGLNWYYREERLTAAVYLLTGTRFSFKLLRKGSFSKGEVDMKFQGKDRREMVYFSWKNTIRLK